MGIQEKIEAYLEGALSGEQLESFEQQLKTDKSLAEEVAIQRELMQYLPSSPKDELLASLKDIGQNYQANQQSDTNKWLPLLGLLLLLGASIWYGINIKNANYDLPALDTTAPSPAPITPIVPQDTLEENPVIDTTTSQPKELPTTPPVKEPKSPKEFPQLPQPEKKSEPKFDPAIAANFEPNPALEDFISNTTRSGNFSFDIQKVDNLRLSSQQLANLRYEGTLDTGEDLNNYTFKLLLFSNKISDYENFNPVKSWTLSFEASTNDSYSFNIKEALNLSKGLYYFYLEDADSGIIYEVQKFEVQ